MKKHLWTLLAFTLLTATSCQQKIDIEADEQALINLTAESWDENSLAGNFDANAETYTNDAIRIVDGKVYEGREAIANLLKSYIGDVVLRQNNKAEDIRISGDLATVRGSFVGSFVLKETGDTLNLKSVWVDICERQADGKWKMVLTIVHDLED